MEQGLRVRDASGQTAGQCAAQVFRLDRFEQVVHRPVFEGTDCILVIGRNHDDLAGNLRFGKDVEAVSVRQFHVHEHDIRLVLCEPTDGA